MTPVKRHPPSSVHAFKKTRGGQQQRKPLFKRNLLPVLGSDDAHAEVTTSHRKISSSLDCGRKDKFGWASFKANLKSELSIDY